MNKQNNTIKKKIMFMAILAIVIPSVFLFVFISLYQVEILENKKHDELTIQAQHNAKILADRFNAIIELSEHLTYEAEIERLSDKYNDGVISENQYYNKVVNELKENFYYSHEFLFTAIILENNTEQLYSYGSAGRQGVFDFANNVKGLLPEITENLDVDIYFHFVDEKLYMIRNLMTTNDYQKYGTIVHEVSTDFVFKEFMENPYFRDYTVFTLNEHSFSYGQQKETNLSKDDVFKVSNTIQEEKFTLKCEVSLPKQILVSEERQLIINIILLILSVLCLLAVLLIKLYTSITKPIEQLSDAFKKMEEGDLGFEIHYNKKSELGFLLDGFNNMSVGLEVLVNRGLKEELKLKEAKIAALQSQINPHFVNNTLEIINWKAQKLGSDEISKMLRNLSIIMCAQTNRSNKKVVTVRKEMEYVESYFYILQRRFEDKISITRDVDENLLDVEIPLLIIQPILENAIVHAIEKSKGGSLDINIQQIDQDICIAITNDGANLTLEDEEKIQKLLLGVEQTEKNSVGIYNVNQRLKYLYGDKYGLSIYKNEQALTVAKMIFPIKEQTLPINDTVV